MATFTFNENLLADRDYLRLRIGDTQAVYRRFWDEELNEILVQSGNDLDKAIAECFAIQAQDPDRLIPTRDGTAGAFTLLSLMQLYATRSNEWFAS